MKMSTRMILVDGIASERQYEAPMVFGMISESTRISRGENGGNDTEVFFAKEFDRLGTYTGRTDGVGDGVERKNGTHRAIYVVFILFHQRGSLVALILLHRDKRHRSRK